MYEKYAKSLREGDMTADLLRSIYTPEEGVKAGQNEDFADRVIAIHQELLDQQQRAGGKIPVAGGKIGKDDAVWDMAFRLAETGTSSMYDLGQRQVERTGEGYNGPETYMDTELYHKPTGAAVDFKRSSGGTDLDYQLQFSPDGSPIMYTTPKQSDWMQFRESTLRPMVNFAAPFIPGAGPWIAAANAAYAASKGDWEKALMSGLAAAVPLAGKFGASAQTASTLNNVRQAANVLKALEDKDLLGAAMSGAGLAGVTEAGGYSMKDINQAIGMVKALESEDPTAIIRAGAGYLPKGGVSGPDSKDFIAGYFEPGGEGYYDPGQPDDTGYKPTTDFSVGADYSLAPKEDGLGFKVTAPPEVFNPDGSVNYDLFDYDALSQLGMDMPKSPNLDDMGGGQGLRLPVEGGYITEQGFIPEGYTPDLGDPNSFINKPAPSATTKPPSTPAKPGTPPKPPTPGGGVDVNALMALLGGGQQAAPTVVSSGQDNSADIELMQDIFGTTLSAPPAGDTVTQARELARLLRS